MINISKKETVNQPPEIIINNFEEEGYLDANLDIKHGIEKGDFKNARHHLDMFGLNEIKCGDRKFHKDFEPFDEDKYCELFLDVSSAIESKDYGPGFEHFCQNGYKDIIDAIRSWERSDLEEIALEPNIVVNDIEDNIVLNNEYPKEAREILNATEKLDISKWKSWLKNVPEMSSDLCYEQAHIEVAASTKKIESGLVVGWTIQKDDSIIWLEDSNGNPYFLEEAYRIFREDVFEVFYELMSEVSLNTGIIIPINGMKPGEYISFKALSTKGVHTLNSILITPIDSHPKKLAEWLFTIHSPLSDLSSRFTNADWLLIDEVLHDRQNLIMGMPEDVNIYGNIEENINVSIIIPLYGRIDFMEHQMIEFFQDEYVKNKVEIIYVIDDSSLVEPLKTICANLYNLYQISFKTVWGGLNRGFSGANNLGAKHSHGEYIIFMNSDLFPKGEAWIEPLVKVLEENADIGVVAPRLLFADGSIQHAGIEFKHRSELGVWINHHPYMGLSPSLDPHQNLTILPAVTGACMVLRREDFDTIKGWDTGYLIGDFEDTDLCLKLYETGKKSAYLPTVELIHLERQSFSSIGSSDFKTKLVILNATRHQNRWNGLITELSTKEKS